MSLQIVIHDVTIRLRRPIHTSRGPVSDRPGLRLELRDPEGNVGLGELAPLSGWSEIDLAQARAELDAWARDTEAEHTAVPVGVASLETCAAIDAAIWSLRSCQTGQALWRLLAREVGGFAGTDTNVEGASASLAVNRLISGSTPGELAEDAARAQDGGARTLKAKMGFNDDRERLSALADAVRNDSRVRLDANSAWDVATAGAMAQAASGALGGRLEYIEDPVANLDALGALRVAVDVPFAVDELVRSASDLEEVVDRRLARVLVIKPPLIGGITAAATLARQASAAQIDVVVSSLYDGPIALRAWCHLAVALGGSRAHGLGTADLLDDASAAPLIARAGRVYL